MKPWSKKSHKETKTVKHPKPDRKKVEVKPKHISQKKANLLFFGFCFVMVGLAALTVLSNGVRAAKGLQPTQTVSKENNSRNLSNRVGLFMTDFLNSYFNDGSSESLTKLNSFYGPDVDIKNTSTTKKSSLTGATLIEITDNLAAYRVAYQVETDTDTWEDNVGVMAIPYKAKGNSYYVSELPYFIDEDSYVAKTSNTVNRLADQSDDKKDQKVLDYITAFLKAYTSGDRNQMLPFSKNIKPVLGYVFTSLDYSYIVKKDSTYTVAIQTTFTDGLGLDHQEDFTLTLSYDKKQDTYFVDKMQHGISDKIRKAMTN